MIAPPRPCSLVGPLGPDGQQQPLVHAEAWQTGATLHAALAQHPAADENHDGDDQADEVEPDDQEHGLLGDVRSRVRRRAAGMTLENIEQALAAAQEDLRIADRHADAGHESAYATAAETPAEWQRIHDHTAATRAERYDPDHDTAFQHALRSCGSPRWAGCSAANGERGLQAGDVVGDGRGPAAVVVAAVAAGGQ